MLILISCPECARPAEVIDRFALASTDGSVEHLAVSCLDGHHLRMPLDALPASSRSALREQAAAAPAARTHP